MLKTGDTIDDKYIVRDIFTNGGMGLVYRVHYLNWGMDIAMKCPRAELFKNEKQKKLFTDECDTWMKLGSHQNIVTCHYVTRVCDIPSVFTKFVNGGSLLEWIRNGKLYAGSPYGRALAVVENDKRLVVVDTKTSERIFEYNHPGKRYDGISFDLSGRWFALIHDDHKLDLFQLYWDV